MKTHLRSIGLSLVVLFVLAAGVTMAQSSEKTEQKKHLKLVKIENGQKTVIDTMITGDLEDQDWLKELGVADALEQGLKMKQLKIDVQKDGKEEQVFIMKDDMPFFGMDDLDVVTEILADGDSIQKLITIGAMDPLAVMRMPHPPHPPHPPKPMVWFGKHGSDHTILDLNGEDILSFKKKDLSGGREKIEIIRKKPAKSEQEFEEEIEFSGKE